MILETKHNYVLNKRNYLKCRDMSLETYLINKKNAENKSDNFMRKISSLTPLLQLSQYGGGCGDRSTDISTEDTQGTCGGKSYDES